MNTDKHSATKPRPTELGTQFRRGRFPFFAGGLPLFVQEGHRRRLAGGKSAAADAAPGNGCDWFRAPTGHRRNGREAGHSLAWHWSGVRCPTFGELRGEGGMLSDCRPKNILRCPAGAWLFRCGNRGRRPLTRACPRLISFGVPPGPGANRQRRLSDVAKVGALRTKVSVSLSSVRNGGEGRGEEALCNAGAARNGVAPLSPALSPFVPHGARETERDSFRRLRRDLSHRLMAGGRIAADAPANSPRRARVLKSCSTDEGRKHCPSDRVNQSIDSAPLPSVSIRVHPWFHFGF